MLKLRDHSQTELRFTLSNSSSKCYFVKGHTNSWPLHVLSCLQPHRDAQLIKKHNLHSHSTHTHQSCDMVITPQHVELDMTYPCPPRSGAFPYFKSSFLVLWEPHTSHPLRRLVLPVPCPVLATSTSWMCPTCDGHGLSTRAKSGSLRSICQRGGKVDGYFFGKENILSCHK